MNANLCDFACPDARIWEYASCGKIYLTSNHITYKGIRFDFKDVMEHYKCLAGSVLEEQYPNGVPNDELLFWIDANAPVTLPNELDNMLAAGYIGV